MWKTKGREEHRLALHEERLKATPPEMWLDYDVQAYLGQAMWVVYYAYLLYSEEHESLPTSHELFVEDGYLAQWPDNPLNDWRPMRVLNIEDGFSPGDFCLQVCPPEYYSSIGIDETGPSSFELVIYAADMKQALVGAVRPIGRNAEWAEIQDGALFGAGYFRDVASAGAREKAAEETVTGVEGEGAEG